MFTLNCKGRVLAINQPLVMGIINVTPDSFYEGSRNPDQSAVLRIAEQMLTEGADILDLGGQSTRPGSTLVDAGEELQRIVAPIEAIHRNFPDAIISIDSFYSNVVKTAVEAGASLVNDTSAGSIDPQLIPTVAGLRVPYVLMHMKGMPGNMQASPAYEDVTRDVLDFLIQKKVLLQEAGITDIIVDPGFGFGKTPAHNFELLKNLSVFKMLQAPLLLGISRKSTISKTLGVTTEQALNGTTVLNTIGLMQGASILRVHDVKEAREAVILHQHCIR